MKAQFSVAGLREIGLGVVRHRESFKESRSFDADKAFEGYGGRRSLGIADERHLQGLTCREAIVL